MKNGTLASISGSKMLEHHEMGGENSTHGEKIYTQLQQENTKGDNHLNISCVQNNNNNNNNNNKSKK